MLQLTEDIPRYHLLLPDQIIRSDRRLHPDFGWKAGQFGPQQLLKTLKKTF
jgi:hypothetical protein